MPTIDQMNMNNSSSLKRKVPPSQTVNKNKDEKRSKHNEIERKRRDKINNWIGKLSKIVPGQNESAKQAQSKGVILSKVKIDLISLLVY